MLIGLAVGLCYCGVMAIYFALLLAAAAPPGEAEIVRDIHARPGSVWEATEGLVDDRAPPLGYEIAEEDASIAGQPSLAYDLSGMGKWDKGRRDRAEAAFEEAVDMAKDAREDIFEPDFGQPD